MEYEKKKLYHKYSLIPHPSALPSPFNFANATLNKNNIERGFGRQARSGQELENLNRRFNDYL
jgi:hypothetical protein